ncbi:hypothetical protein CHGG_04804 [Chaetomium globosum CBS 148.51]|uniref:Uncharacterized protein n=1 Tax=Chaetomium globosum (strain ATCC 6205 / CBS 148.51 / DSM 1962 / NBRC 6347 / NRRL 1970) TaxID=306901 RepID=Q2H092_CHAGB|nr:uncharacterized protein CHGG_04804 [Chaetomium globosum CBS 148.51]EAQ88185.1 hypothetical protein CHGG_04804 [Chaetomium globosum CBS 148.51]
MAGASLVGTMPGRGGPGLGASGNTSLMASLTPDELAEIREYGKLLRFRDEVVGGLHPRIKPSHPPGKAAQNQKAQAPASAVPAPSKPVKAKSAVIDKSQSRQANRQRAQVNMASGVPGLGTLSGALGSAKASGPGKTEIHPVLLEKSDDLVKAEIQLQRQRVERSLKEQLDQHRGPKRASKQLAELDVADILAKAMSLVLATPLAQPTDDTAANVSASNDSADDDTFYSSRHDTPESNMVSRLPNESEDEEMREGSPYEPELDLSPVVLQPQPAILPQQQPNPAMQAQSAPTSGVTVPGLSIDASSSTRVHVPQAPAAFAAVQQDSGGRSEESTQTGSTQLSGSHDLARVNERLLNQALVRDPPLVRGHDLSPVAPQPTHVLPPAIAREPQLGPAESGSASQAPPAQVAALRKQPSNGSSPESSPHSSKAAEKKKNKKKKRKADRLAADTAADSPYIKPEPRSPSPLTPQFARPNKRQRYSQQQPVEIQDDEPRYEQPMPAETGYQGRYQPRVVRQERVVGYERADEYRTHHGEEPILVASPRYERVYYDDYRAPPPSGYPAGPEPVQYVSREVRTMRPASRVVEGSYEDGATYRDVRTASRMSVRPAAYPERSQSPSGYERPSVAMPPPRTAARRIIVDAFGREYLEPVRPATIAREEVAAEPRGPYERVLAPRGISHRPEPLDDDAVLYHPTSPAYSAPRRVFTQPEYSYREPAGPSNPMAPPTAEYLPSRPEPPLEYIARSASVRPPMESARYDTYEQRIPAPIDDRPLAPPREYYRAATARPVMGEGHLPPLPREYAAATPGGRRVEYAHPGPPPLGPAGGAAPVGYQYHPQGAGIETMLPPAPPARAYSVAPGEMVRMEYPPVTQQQQQQQQQQPPVERYYGRPGQDEEVVFLERGPSGMMEGYR